VIEPGLATTPEASGDATPAPERAAPSDEKVTTPTNEAGVPGSRSWYGFSVADFLFIFFTVSILQHAGTGMMDDPGLGWHLRIADLMWENRGFIYHEQLCYPTEGQPWVTQAWLGDILMRLVYAWGDMNGLAVLTTLCIALTLRLLYTRMTSEGAIWPLAGLWSFLAALGTSPAWTARPNVFTFPALVLTASICERYSAGVIPARRTLCLLLIFLLWPNLHGGFLAGIIVLGITYLVTCAVAFGSFDREQRLLARKQWLWWTILGFGLFAATLVNPYGFGLYLWNLRMVTDPFIQTMSTTEWFPPNFTDLGWFRIELLILLFPLLTALSSRRVSLLPLALGVIWLHFALTTRRYTSLWVLLIVPTMGLLCSQVPWLRSVAASINGRLSKDAQEWLTATPRHSPCFFSFLFAGLLLALSPWMGNLGRHNQDLLPSQSLDKLLQIYRGERVFHLLDWGGYLTWHGWNLKPRFKTWIDDRMDTHGPEHTEKYRAILNAQAGWEKLLNDSGVDLLCVPPSTQLAGSARVSPNWRLLYEDRKVVIIRRISSVVMQAVIPACTQDGSPANRGHGVGSTSGARVA
jgi:hypothetical protein